MRRVLVLLASLATCLGLSTLPASATPSYCGLAWSSQDQSTSNYSGATVADVRAGRHECFDRLVIDLSGPTAGYRVGYVGTVTQEGSGAAVPLRGGAFLQIAVMAPAYDNAGNSTYNPPSRTELVGVNGYPTFRQAAFMRLLRRPEHFRPRRSRPPALPREHPRRPGPRSRGRRPLLVTARATCESSHRQQCEDERR